MAAAAPCVFVYRQKSKRGRCGEVGRGRKEEDEGRSVVGDIFKLVIIRSIAGVRIFAIGDKSDGACEHAQGLILHTVDKGLVNTPNPHTRCPSTRLPTWRFTAT